MGAGRPRKEPVPETGKTRLPTVEIDVRLYQAVIAHNQLNDNVSLSEIVRRALSKYVHYNPKKVVYWDKNS